MYLLENLYIHHLLFSGRTVVYRGPVPSTVELNRTAFLYCSASYHYSLDLSYQWAFNGRVINLDNHIHYRRVSYAPPNTHTSSPPYCLASYHYSLDLSYQWAFNGRVINLDNHIHYRRVSYAPSHPSPILLCLIPKELKSFTPLGLQWVCYKPGQPYTL